MFILFKSLYGTIAVFLFFQISVFAGPSYSVILQNGKQVDNFTYEFDVTINSIDDNFELTSYQAALSFDIGISDSGIVTFVYIENTSELSNIPSIGIGVSNSDSKPELTFASLPGSDLITDRIKRIGRFRLQSSNSFDVSPSINWNFQGNIISIITGPGFECITNSLYHTSDLGGLKRFWIRQITSSGFADNNSFPEKTIDGRGYYDDDPVSRWAVRPMPQWISYDLGSEQIISMVKISFFNFHLNRIYEYSISVSDDNPAAAGWTEIISNASSVPQEWTIAEFSPVTARYIKLDIISSTEKQNGWASIWETEIWGEGLTTSAEQSKPQPSDFELLQNYPNPFNPSTKIQYSIPESGELKLVIYNSLGEKIRTLVNSYIQKGQYIAVWDGLDIKGAEVSSGVYFYEVIFKGNRTYKDVKKMLLLR